METRHTGDMEWTVIIPVKPAAAGKSRLGLGPELARALALDTVAAVVASEAVGRVIVVTSDPEFHPHGVEIAEEKSPSGIDAAIRAGVALSGSGRDAARDAGPLAALLGDLPSLRPQDLAVALAAAGRHPRAFVADRESTGTTLVTAAAGVSLLTAFGAASAAAHRALGLVQLDLPADSTVTADVDTVEQLELARGLGVGRATRLALRHRA
ncbi:2-phospho-L-lactate guanylyltransferase [soil metagenome]